MYVECIHICICVCICIINKIAKRNIQNKKLNAVWVRGVRWVKQIMSAVINSRLNENVHICYLMAVCHVVGKWENKKKNNKITKWHHDWLNYTMNVD